MSYFLYLLRWKTIFSLNFIFLYFLSSHSLFIWESDIPALLNMAAILSADFVKRWSLFLYLNRELRSEASYFVGNALSSLCLESMRMFSSLLFPLLLDWSCLIFRLNWFLLLWRFLLQLDRLLFRLLGASLLKLWLFHLHLFWLLFELSLMLLLLRFWIFWLLFTPILLFTQPLTSFILEFWNVLPWFLKRWSHPTLYVREYIKYSNMLFFSLLLELLIKSFALLWKSLVWLLL